MSLGKDISNLSYKGYKSTTFILVVFGYVSGTLLLIGDYITPLIWETSVLSMLSGYIVRDGISKVAEGYFGKRIADLKPEPLVS